MKDAEQPVLVMIGGVVNIIAGLFNMFIGLLWIWLCIGIVPMAVGLWQVIAGGIALTGGVGETLDSFGVAIWGDASGLRPSWWLSKVCLNFAASFA